MKRSGRNLSSTLGLSMTGLEHSSICPLVSRLYHYHLPSSPLFYSWRALFIYDVHFTSVERKQSVLSGRAQGRADNISNLPYESKIINHLVTTDRLKEYGFLSEAVGTICPFQDFYGGRPIKRKAPEVEEPASEDGEIPYDEASNDQGAPDDGSHASFSNFVSPLFLTVYYALMTYISAICLNFMATIISQ